MRLHLMLTVFFLLLVLCLSSAGTALAQAPKEITNSIGMKLVLIPKGTFMMGSPPSEEGSKDDERQHEVTLTRDYYLGAFEVTQLQYLKVMGSNPSYFQGKEVEQKIPAKKNPQTGRTIEDEKVIAISSLNHPVDQIPWEEAVKFCKKLSDLPEEKKAGRVYRLPTEAEWEYACRAGTTTAYSFDDAPELLGQYAWFSENSNGQTHPVGEKKPNAWGLYDMHGNVWEWCSDWYGDYHKGAVSDPEGANEGRFRVLRGGRWVNPVEYFRSACRFKFQPSGRSNASSGFRVALNVPEKQK